MGSKIIRDSLHGYISLPKKVVSEIIDTPIFQRLRNIEQTSMRPLYPSAHHNRFIHSLGVYYLGEKALEGLIKNIKSDDRYYNENNKISIWKHYGLLFKLACLLHDCAHSPFSHSFEFAYLGSKDGEKWETVKKELIDSLDCNDNEKKEYINDINKLFNTNPAPHEVFSAIIVAQNYEQAIKQICEELFEDFSFEIGHIEFIQRAILGMKYDIDSVGKEKELKEEFTDTIPTTQNDGEIEQKKAKLNILNCLIQLLNSKSFDVDKLDYIMRDSVSAGINNLSVDVDRLLGALTIIEMHQFINEINIDYDINNSVTFSGNEKTSSDGESLCALNLNLEDADIDGVLVGNITTEKDFKLTSSELRQSLNGSTTTFETIKGTDGKIQAHFDKAKIVGNFIGSIKATGKKGIDGFMKCHINGSIKGTVIGAIENWKDKGITIYEIGYKQSALSIIDDTIYARNRLYLWVYAHHKVTYIDYLLRYAVLYSLLDKKEDKSFGYADYNNAKEKLEKLLSLNIFDKTRAKDNYLIDDSNFLTKISQGRDENAFAEKYLSRTKEYSVWKSFAEYNRFFYDLTAEEKKKIWESLFVGNDYKGYETTYNTIKEGTVQMFKDSVLKDYEGDCDFVWIKPSGYKVNKIESSETYLVSNDGSVRRFQDVIEKDKTTEEYVDKNYFYLYTAKEMDNNEKFKLVSFLKSKIRTV